MRENIKQIENEKIGTDKRVETKKNKIGRVMGKAQRDQEHRKENSKESEQQERKEKEYRCTERDASYKLEELRKEWREANA